MKLAIFLTLVAVATAIPRTVRLNGPGFRPQIVGGEQAGEKEFPYHVVFAGLHGTIVHIPYCEGAIYDETRVITTATCAAYLSSIEPYIFAGTNFLGEDQDQSEAQVRGAASVILHDNWDASTYDNDIAIVTLDAPLVFTDRVQPIRLAESSFVPSGDVVVTGFGEKSDGDYDAYLQKATLHVISGDECEQDYSSVAGIPPITQNMVCAIDDFKGICVGDLGAPLVAKDEAGRDYLAGVASFGVIPCGSFPSVFAKIAPLRQWLESKLNP